jgi:hypothetical protein
VPSGICRHDLRDDGVISNAVLATTVSEAAAAFVPWQPKGVEHVPCYDPTPTELGKTVEGDVYAPPVPEPLDGKQMAGFAGVGAEEPAAKRVTGRKEGKDRPIG